MGAIQYITSLVTQMVKNLPASAGDPGLIPGSGRSAGEGNGNALSTLAWRIPGRMGRGTWQAIVHGVAKSQTRLSN